MAASVDVNSNDELNSILKTLAGRDKEAEIYKKYNDFFTGSLLPQLYSTSNKSEVDGDYVKMWAYGSAAEDLQSFDHCDAGDMDFMIFPNLDEMIIREEMLEYSLENPLHVTIKGGDNLVLQSCLVENTEYVATSALKNFHPAIFGSKAPTYTLISLLSFFCQMEERGTILSLFNAQIPFFNLKNSPTSPAVSLGMSSWMDSATILATDYLNILANVTAAVVGCIIHLAYRANGKEYAKEHANFLKDSLMLVMDYCNLPMLNPLANFLFICGPAYQEQGKKLFARLEGLESRSLNDAVHDNDQEIVSPEARDNKGSKGNDTDFSEAFRFLHLSCDRLNKFFARLKGLKSGSFNETVHNKDLNSKNLSSDRDGKDDDDDKNEFKRSKTLTDELESKFEVTELVKNGIDFIPAFRSHGWPKVAREWIQRERKWPCPEIVDKVIQEGFHLVVKPPKNNGNPECDFRISFSHAEYLLSQEMNDIQRECYRCFKRYHRAYLSTQPKSLVSFHLKNIFLQTIEETGVEMWTESNRAEYMIKLLRNLLKALRKKDLRHFFVRSYNLFGEDYIDNPEILESLAEKAEKIMENPMRFAKELILKQEDSKECKKEKDSAKENLKFAKPVPRQQQMKTEGISSEGNYDAQCKKDSLTVSLLQMEATQGSDPSELECRYHDLTPFGIFTQFAQSAFSNLHGTESTPVNKHGDIPLD